MRCDEGERIAAFEMRLGSDEPRVEAGNHTLRA